MHQEQRKRTVDLLKQHGINRALFTDPHTITWLTGFAPPIQTGSNLFEGSPPLIWYEDGQFILVVVNNYATQAAHLDQDSDGKVIIYMGYTVQDPLSGIPNLQLTMRELMKRSVARGKVGIEMSHCTLLVSNAMQEILPAMEFVPLDGWLEPLRMIKTDEELVKLRQNFALIEVGHAVARKIVKPGLREIDVWSEVHGAIEREAGCRVPLGNDCIVGYRQQNIGGWPKAHELKADDSLIVDLSTILHGYWSDSCATYFATEPNATHKKLHQTVSEALDMARSLIKPGVKANHIDQQTRQFIADAGYNVYRHHTGHGVGVSGHEEPRIVPYNETKLQSGMVIMLEPGIYLPGQTGVRLEDAYLVTADGAEQLTHHDKRLP
ncbi:Xaa-Pro peptidase family protein [Anaerolineales bacterium HSG6]|nr:Xaa-Pro peptidase family protein [Anaerolineales bacterium HSG6]MDM8530557.1 Xaa-Pro peptidase family protein [Anaerolineales bacterium HSG25]